MVKHTVNKEVFAERLSNLMDTYNETIYTIGELLNLSPATISRYSNAGMAPKITTIEVLANYFKVNPAWLMGYDVPRELIIDESSTKVNKSNELDIFTQAAHLVGHEGPLTEEQKEKIELAIKIALAKHDK